MDFSQSILAIVTAALLIIAASLLLFLVHSLKYWQKRSVVTLKPSLLFGNLENPLVTKKSQGVQYKGLYERLKKLGLKYGGVYSFMAPVFVPLDPEIIKCILTKDFQHFHARGFFCNERDQPISAHLFTIDGVKWRNLRTKFTPVFTSGKMKTMFQILSNCNGPMKDKLAKFSADNKAVNIKHIMSCYTADIIAACAFGLDCNSFDEPETVLYRKVKYATDKGTSILKGAFCFSFPELAKALRMVPFPREPMRYFVNVIEDTVSHREQNKVRRSDFLQLLIDLKNKGPDGANEHIENLTLDEISAQSFLFYFAGFETSSSTMTFCLYELARNQDIQQKARDDVNAVLRKFNGEITYDSIGEMKYLQKVVDETLRKYPSVPILNRKCTEDYKIPDTDITIEKGTQVVIPILGIQYDPEFYPDPEKFDPERFSEEAKSQRPTHTYLPFGEGPRHCIGLRFGTMQTKTGLAVLLKNFNFSLNRATKNPLSFTSNFLLAAAEDILLDVEQIND